MLVFKSLKKSLGEMVKELNLDLRYEEIRLLHVIHEFNEPVQQELSNHLLTDKSLILRRLLDLEKLGYVNRVTDEVDKRKKRVVLTDRGKEIVLATARLREKVIEDMLSGVSGARRDIFYSVLKDMYANTLKEN